ncbi:hypothetical protein JP75_11480 [Devosia riboflavina]|uniref:Uncharacterized protein n=1 Tax=Devosia riboflavina TaxID=46914 RepID=A0A087M267_9HYPH|nr:hypothetical protein JP75_11480 [Devosia riboflavina]
MPALELRDLGVGPAMVTVALCIKVWHILSRVAFCQLHARLHRPAKNSAQRLHHAVRGFGEIGFHVARPPNMARLEQLVWLRSIGFEHVTENKFANVLSARVQALKLGRFIISFTEPGQALRIGRRLGCSLRRDLTICGTTVLQQECVGSRLF